jgi:hypothetical protein
MLQLIQQYQVRVTNRTCTILKSLLKSCSKKETNRTQNQARKIIHLPKSFYRIQLPAQVK